MEVKSIFLRKRGNKYHVMCEYRTQEGKRRESGDVNGEKGVAQCVGSLCVHALMSSLCECGVDKKGWEGHREKTRKRKKLRVFWEKRRKRKAATPKAQTHKIKTTLFSLFFFSL